MKNLLLLIFTILTLNSFGQDTISVETVNQFSYSFSIENFQLEGRGAEVLNKEFEKSQFVLIGESHDMAEISIFTSSIIPILKNQGFGYFFTENGNHGLQRMIAHSASDSSIQSGLSNFYTQEYKRLKSKPMPFFTGVEDSKFLELALNNKLNLYGIDQEYFYSFPLLFDALLDLSSKSLNIKNAHKTAIDYILNEYEQERSQKNYPIFTNLLKSEEVNAYFELLDTTEIKTKTIIKDIKLSWHIYQLNQADRQKSFAERGALMTKQFYTFYNQIGNAQDDPAKILIKMGAYHTQRGKTPLGIYDIGETVSKLAAQNQSKDLNLLFMFRYYIDDEEPLGYFDNSDNNSKWVNERKPFTKQGSLDKWTIIDLKSLNELVKSKDIYVYAPLMKIINGHDYVIIPPASREVTQNRRIE